MAEVKSTRQKMAELAVRAKAVKANPNLKHNLTQRQAEEAKENAILMLPYQQETMKEDSYERI